MDFLAFVKMRCDGKENRRSANRVDHHEINDKGRDEIFDHLLDLVINCAGLAAG